MRVGHAVFVLLGGAGGMRVGHAVIVLLAHAAYVDANALNHPSVARLKHWVMR